MPDDKPRVSESTFEWGPVCLKLPHFIVVLASMVGLILGSAWVYLHYIHEDVIRVIIQMEDSVAGVQEEESLKHIIEDPDRQQVYFDGKLKVKHFASDDCVLVEWREPGSYAIPTFVPHPRRTFDEVKGEPKVSALSLSGVAWAAELMNRCDYAECLEAERCEKVFKEEGHPGRFEQVVKKPEEECGAAIIWRRYEDCCLTRQLYWPCEDRPDPVEWRCCRH